MFVAGLVALILVITFAGMYASPLSPARGKILASEAGAASKAAASASGSSLGIDPPYLSQMGMTYDPSGGFVLSFGGVSPYGVVTDYTLTYSNGTWTNLTADLSNSPPPMTGASVAYDAVDQEVVLFGGCLASSCYPALGNTWIFANETWTMLPATDGGPSPRAFAAMTWDYADNEIVLFGGEQGTATSSFTYYNDTWAFVHNRWTNLTSNLSGPSPAPRADAGLADTPGSTVTLFGGLGSVDYSDTWSFQDRSWTNVSATSGSSPSVRRSVAFAGDPMDGADVLFGGYYHGSYFGDTWVFASGHWTKLAATGPPGTFSAGFAYDALSSQFVLYGGLITQDGNSGTTNGVWLFNGTSWKLTNPAAPQAFPWILLVPAALVPIIIVQTAVISRRQRRQFKQLSDLLPPRPGEDVRWIPTDLVATRAWNRRQRLIPIVVVIPGGVILPLLILSSGAVDALVDTVAVASFFLLVGGMAVLLSRTQSRMRTQAVGILSGGVIVKRPGGEIRAPWAYIQPPNFVPRGPFFNFHITLPGKGTIGGGFTADRAQSLAIIGAPGAPVWTISPPVRSALGLEPAWDPRASSTYPGVRAAGPLPSSSIGEPLYPAPPPPPPVSPPPVPAISLPLTSTQQVAPPPPSGPPQVRRCPRCGRLSMLSARFCSNCGAPMTVA